MSFSAITASAYTADDVAAKARQAGWPENLIQTGYNQWASGEYTQAQLDEAYNSVCDYNEQTEEFIYNSFGIDPVEARKKAAQQATEAETQPDAQNDNQNVSPADNSSTYISDSDFINMSMEEKQEYVNSLPDEQKTDFINSLSTEARNSIIKQLPTQDKAAIMQKYIDTADTMGMHVTVDNIGEKDISVSSAMKKALSLIKPLSALLLMKQEFLIQNRLFLQVSAFWFRLPDSLDFTGISNIPKNFNL